MNFLKMKRFAGILVFLAMSSAPSFAQAGSMTSQEQKNLKMVLDWWREVIVAHHVELAPKYQAEDYIQHNPNIATGRAAFVEFFGGLGPPQTIQPTLAHPPVKAFGKGDYVVLIWEHEAKDPADASKTYKYNGFDVLRIQKGKIQEHWDDAMKTSTKVIAAAEPAPASLTAHSVGSLTPQEKKNQEIATREMKDILQYGHLELAPEVIAEGYIQHNPNVATGRDAFVDFFRQFAKPQPIQPDWKAKPALILTSGDLVFFLIDRTGKDPADPTKEYKYNWFDMIRVDDGKVQEHWDAARKNPPAPRR
jgi:predicted SnoaL-like aldol condensation-catalyzing enzyme